MAAFPDQFGRLTREIGGNVLPMAAGGMIVAAALVGSGIDMGRAYLVQNRLAAACDAAVLAGRRGVTTGGFDSAAQTQANSYFNANFDAASFGARNGSFSVSSAESGNTINGTATASVDTTIMRLFGRNEFALNATCTATMGVGNSDVMMVLDTTGSMDWTLAGTTTTRIQALRSAMKNFYTTVATAIAGSNARVRYGFVPYSSAVNVGALLYNLNPAYLVDSYTIQSREAVFTTGGSGDGGGWGGGWGGWGGSSGSGSGGTSFSSWSYKPITYDVSTYKTFAPATTNTGSNGSAVTSTWDGCIEERSTVSDASFSYANGAITPSAADLDIDSAPTAATSSKWAPMWPEVVYYRTSGGYMTNTSPTSSGSKAASYCPRPARLLATMTQTDFNAYADALSPDGATYHDIGMVWGARLSSPTGIFASNVNEVPANGGSVARHMVFMTDGEMSTGYSFQTSWGIEYHDRRVTDDGYSNNNERHNSRFLALCGAVKAKGIRVWVIAFGATMTTELSTCASSGSSFTASNAAQLNSAFQEIAKQVGELRVVQ